MSGSIKRQGSGYVADCGYAAPRLDEPIVVIAYARSGIVWLRDLLESHQDVLWLGGFDAVQLCDQLVQSWVTCEAAPNSQLSSLGKTSIRRFMYTMLTPRIAATGASHWCIASTSRTPAVRSFMSIYPQARFLCLHRNCFDMIFSGISACPWGLSGTGYGFESFALAYPGNPVAALAEYWASHTESMLAFESEYQDRCRRVRYEDLAEDHRQIDTAIRGFLGLAEADVLAPKVASAAASEVEAAVGAGADVPLERIPSEVLARVRTLLDELGYSG